MLHGPINYVHMNSRGTSLLQVLVALGVMSIIAVGFATMMSQMSAQQNIMQAKQDLFLLTEQIRTTFANRSICEQSLPSNFKFDPTVAAKDTDGLPFEFRIDGDVVKSGQTLQNYNLTANRLEIVKAVSAGSDTANNTIYKADLVGQFSPKNKTAGLRDFAQRTIASAYFTISPSGDVVSCANEGPVDNTCVALGGKYDPQSKKCDFLGDSAAQLCEAMKGTFDGKNCSLGAPAGFASCSSPPPSSRTINGGGFGGGGSGPWPHGYATTACTTRMNASYSANMGSTTTCTTVQCLNGSWTSR